jgi:hypothetical protein
MLHPEKYGEVNQQYTAFSPHNFGPMKQVANTGIASQLFAYNISELTYTF